MNTIVEIEIQNIVLKIGRTNKGNIVEYVEYDEVETTYQKPKKQVNIATCYSKIEPIDEARLTAVEQKITADFKLQGIDVSINNEDKSQETERQRLIDIDTLKSRQFLVKYTTAGVRYTSNEPYPFINT